MSKRVHEIAKERGLPAKEVLEKLRAAGINVKAVSSSVDEDAAIRVLGNGDAFVARDPSGIRPCHWFENDEVVAFASERAPLCTVFDLEASAVKEVEPGCAVVMKKSGKATGQTSLAEPSDRLKRLFRFS